MPSTCFFATKADLEPGLAALQRKRVLQFVRCEQTSWLDTPDIPTFASLLEATDLGRLEFRPFDRDISRTDLLSVVICDGNGTVSVEEHLIGSALPEGGTIRYQMIMPSPMIILTPGGLHEPSHALWEGEIEADITDVEDLGLYRQAIETLFQGFKRFGRALYGPEALRMGAEGGLYTHVMHEPYKPWTYKNLIEMDTYTEFHVNKPEIGKLSLKESWDWLEEAGYEVHRRANGNPDPYTRRPTAESNPGRGFSFFRTAIEEEELDRLTIPCTYMAHTRCYQVTFRQSDLSRSRFADNNFTYCDFRETDLSEALLADYYLHCTFEGAILTNTDLRWSGFEGCTFTGAKMDGTKLATQSAAMFTLSEEQQAGVIWHDDAHMGPAPREL